MKKLVLLLAVTLVVGSMVWAQWTPPAAGLDPDDFPFDTVFPGFDALGRKSVEYRFAPGFDTMADNFLSPAFYDPKIDTFLFLGGETGEPRVIETNGTFALGAAKTFGSFYAAAYYRGMIIGDDGGKGVSGSNTNDGDKVYKSSEVQWNNNIALLFGVANMGFRFDVISVHDVNNNEKDITSTYDGNFLVTDSLIYGPKLALSWGWHLENLYPSAMIGFKFPLIESVGGVDFTDPGLGVNNGKNATKSSGSALNIEAAALYDFSGGSLNDTVSGALSFGLKFKDSYKGAKEVITGLTGYDTIIASADPNSGKEVDYGGGWGLNLALHYQKTFEWGKFTMRITPSLDMSVIGESVDNSISDTKNPSPTWFSLAPSVALGVKFQAFEKLAFFAGLDLTLLQWTTYATLGGDTKNDTTKWNLKGTGWNWYEYDDGGNTITENFLKFGLAWTPIQGLVVASEIPINALFEFDVQNMTFKPGSLFSNTYASNIGDWAMMTIGKLFGPFNLTVTYSF